MKSYDELYLELSEHFSLNEKTKKRFMHSESVAKMAVKINQALGLDLDDESLMIAGLLHDYAKVYTNDELVSLYQKYQPDDLETLKAPNTIHAFLAPFLLKERYPELSFDILDAIKYHTTGSKEMNDYAKVIYVADAVEETRDYEDLAYYQDLSMSNLNQAVYEVLDYTVKDLKKRGIYIHQTTMDAYSSYQKKDLRDPDLNKVLTLIKRSLLSNVILYETKKVSPFFDYVIATTATNVRLIHAMVEHLRDLAEISDFKVVGYTKDPKATWAIVDLNNIIVHIFLQEDRINYNIDGLYYDLKKELIA